MTTNLTTVGTAVLIQNAIRLAAYVVMLWLTLSFVDRWIMAWIAA